MSLRFQLLLVSLITLILPWAGCQYVREMEGVLRHGQEDALLASAQAISRVLADEPQALYRSSALREQFGDTDLDIYAYRMDTTITIDGFADDWSQLRHQFVSLPARGRYDPYPIREELDGARYAAAVREDNLYLFVSVLDPRAPVFLRNSRAASESADHLILYLRSETGSLRRLWLSATRPGAVRIEVDQGPASTDRRRAFDDIEATMQAYGGGYQFEIRLPLSHIGTEFGLSIVRPATGHTEDLAWWAGTVFPDFQPTLGYLIYPSSRLIELTRPFLQPGLRVRVTDRSGRILLSSGDFAGAAETLDLLASEQPQPMRIQDLYRTILDTMPRQQLIYLEQNGRLHGNFIEGALRGEPQATWRRQSDGRKAVVTVAQPILASPTQEPVRKSALPEQLLPDPPEQQARVQQERLGTVILEQSSDAVLTLSNEAITDLFNTTFLALGVATIGMLGFASLLSARIRRLRDAAERSVTPDGDILPHLIQASGHDELGDLSRSFRNLLRRLDDYNQYLQTLASKLSHELRTPLAVVNSSLENLEQEELSEQARICSNRARDGATRLRSILTALSEATRVEQSIQSAEAEQFDLREVLAGSVQAYAGVYSQHRVQGHLPAKPCRMNGVPDLIVQMLDKLIENAADFTPAGGLIEISLQRQRNALLLSVANEGPTLPGHMQQQLFDQLVSIREKHSDTPHLGLGLHIVKLIVDHHEGAISARNLADNSGVEFLIRFRASRG